MKIGYVVREKIARTIGDFFTTNQIANILADAKIAIDRTLYAKWSIILDAVDKTPNPHESLLELLKIFSHPLNFSEPQNRFNFIDRLNTLLTYENYKIEATGNTVNIFATSESNQTTDNENQRKQLDEYKYSLFLLRLYYSKILEICDAFASGNIAIRNVTLNRYYIVLSSYVDDILSKVEFRELQREKPGLFESLIGDIEHYDVEWESESKQAYNFFAKIEKLHVVSGSPTYNISDNLQTMLQNIMEAIDQHKKNLSIQWQKMVENVEQAESTKEVQLDNQGKNKEAGEVQQNRYDKLLYALDEAMIRGFNGMFRMNESALPQQNVQKVEIVGGNIKVEGLERGLGTIAKTNKEERKNKFPHKLPAGIGWKDIMIQFTNKEKVMISVNRFREEVGFVDMGFIDGRFEKSQPSVGWSFLWVLARYNGELRINDPDAKEIYKKQKGLVTKTLQSYFSVESDPFYPYYETKSYKTRFTLLPPSDLESDGIKYSSQQEEVEQESVDEEIKLFYKEQTPQVYD